MRQKGKFGVIALTGFQTLSGLLVIFIICFSSCRSVYLPNMVNSPLLTQKGEFKATGGFGYSGLNAQLAYSPINNLGVIANGSYNKSHFFGSGHDFRELHTMDLGLGYYNKLPENTFYDFYLGYGQGKTSYFVQTVNPQLTNGGSFSHFFLQPGIGAEGEHFGIGGSLRASMVNMKLFNKDEIITQTSQDFYLEPVLTGEFGYKKVKLFLQVGFSYRIGEGDILGLRLKDNVYHPYDYFPWLVTVGFQITLGRNYPPNS